MRIGILTLPFNNNYGGLLQCYALQEFLKSKGHTVYIINRKPNKQYYSFNENIKRHIKTLLGFSLYSKYKTYNMKNFENRYLECTTPIFSDNQFKILEKYNLECIIVGSDQVWRFQYTKNRYKNYFLDFASEWNIKRYAFAASFGIDSWTLSDEETQNIIPYINKFDGISVREYSGISLCKEYLKCDATHILDPTFLLSKDSYCRLFINKKSSSNKGKILAYILDNNNNKRECLNKISTQLKKEVFHVGKHNQKQYPSIESWLEGFNDADLIVTDSFHGAVFSIIFRKKLILLGNKERGQERFISLLNTFGMPLLFFSDTEIWNDRFILSINDKEYDKIISSNKQKVNKLLTF